VASEAPAATAVVRDEPSAQVSAQRRALSNLIAALAPGLHLAVAQPPTPRRPHAAHAAPTGCCCARVLACRAARPSWLADAHPTTTPPSPGAHGRLCAPTAAGPLSSALSALPAGSALCTRALLAHAEPHTNTRRDAATLSQNAARIAIALSGAIRAPIKGCTPTRAA